MPIRLLLAVLAQATTPPVADAPPQPPQAQQTFIAPSGEPFHAPVGAAYPVAVWFAQADADHDGKLTAAEFTADFMRYFAKLDTNHDGQISSNELDAYETAIASETRSTGGYEADGGGHRRDSWNHDEDEGGGEGEVGFYRPIGSTDSSMGAQGAGRYELLGLSRPVGTMDINFNGRVTRDEASYAADQRFDALDSDHRGYLALDGLPQTYAQEHKGGDQNRKHGRHR